MLVYYIQMVQGFYYVNHFLLSIMQVSQLFELCRTNYFSYLSCGEFTPRLLSIIIDPSWKKREENQNSLLLFLQIKLSIAGMSKSNKWNRMLLVNTKVNEPV